MEASEKEREVRLAVMSLKQVMDGLDWEGTQVHQRGPACYVVTARHEGCQEQRVVVEWDEAAGMPRAVRPGDEAWGESDAAAAI